MRGSYQSGSLEPVWLIETWEPEGICGECGGKQCHKIVPIEAKDALKGAPNATPSPDLPIHESQADRPHVPE